MWVWIIGAIVILLALWLLLGRRGDDVTTPTGADTTKTTSIMSESRSAVATFVTPRSWRS
jgi:hypothetical protein